MNRSLSWCTSAVKHCSRHHKSGQSTVFASSFRRSRCLSTTSSGEPSQEAPSDEQSLRFVSHLKNPIVHQLWTARGKAKEQAVCHEIDLDAPRKPSDSQTFISYDFETDPFLKETYRNPWGQIRFGKILEDLDALAGNIAFAHVQDPRLNLVTASVDRIQLKAAPSIDQSQHLSGKVTYVGTSSMEIGMHCQDSTGKEWMEAYFTFVAMDPFLKKPVKIPPLQPETTQEQAMFKQGHERALAKKKARKQSSSTESSDPFVETTAKELLREAGPLLNMPSLANPYSILSSQTELQTSELAQPQARNLANQFFGGFLMRRACELAYSTAYVFAGRRPIFYEVDQVNFGLPVSVGDLTNFHARVLYTSIHQEDDALVNYFHELQGQSQIPLVSVQVEAWIIDPTQASAKLSNDFYFTFALPSPTPIRRVLPGNMDEARTMAKRMALDHAQTQEYASSS